MKQSPIYIRKIISKNRKREISHKRDVPKGQKGVSLKREIAKIQRQTRDAA